MAISFSRGPTVLTLRLKQSPVWQLASVRALPVLAMMLGGCVFVPNLNSTAFTQQTGARFPVAFPTSLQWPKQRGVTSYRLQIADDEDFRNVFYDGRVVGERYTVSGLPPGYYFWRIAPSERQTGAFLKPVRFFVSGGFIVSGMPPRPPRMPPKLPAVPTSKVR